MLLCHIPCFLLMLRSLLLLFFFFLNDPAPPEIYPLPLHDALPIPRRPAAAVTGSPQGSAVSRPSPKARTIGAHPAACTATRRGLRRSIQPSVCISSNA